MKNHWTIPDKSCPLAISALKEDVNTSNAKSLEFICFFQIQTVRRQLDLKSLDFGARVHFLLWKSERDENFCRKKVRNPGFYPGGFYALCIGQKYME